MEPGKTGRRRRLTQKQRALIKFVTENPDATQDEIAAATGYCGQETVSKTLKNENVQRRMAEAMERDPALCDEALREKIKEGLNATHKQYFAFEGEVTDEKEDVDFATRKSYLHLAGRWKGLELERHEVSGPNGGPIPTGDIQALKGLSKDDLAKLIQATE